MVREDSRLVDTSHNYVCAPLFDHPSKLARFKY